MKRGIVAIGCTLLTLGGGVAGAQTAARNGVVTVPFSDPGRPGTVRINVMKGNVTVRAAAGRDVTVSSEPERDRRDADRPPRTRDRDRDGDGDRDRDGDRSDPGTAGLRRLTQPAGFNVEEENNTISINSPILSSAGNITVQVPASTSVVIRAVTGGDVTVEGVTGAIEVNDINGSIRLTDVGGPVIAHATNGRVVATLRQVASDKPMSFTSFNGNVDVTLPPPAKATLKLRSDRGDVYTDFDVQMRPGQSTTAPATPRGQSGRSSGSSRNDDPDKDKGKFRIQMDRTLYGTINGGGPDVELRTFNGNIYLRKAK